MSKILPYYNYDKLFSYNGVYNMAVGGRGIGKTYGAKEKAIRQFIRKSEQFIYVRRYKEELKAAKETFFADIVHKFPDYDFRINGYVAEMAPANTRDEKKRVWDIVGYFVSLSTAQKLKSVAYPRVTLIIFDEFIIEKGALHYLPNETIVFNNFYSTVDRAQDKTRVLFLANAVSIDNPYFIEWDIEPNREWVFKQDKFIVAHFPEAKDFATAVYETRFGKFIAGTEYAEYAVGNVFADNNDNLVAKKDPRARYTFTLETAKGTFSIWHNVFSDEWYAQTYRPKGNEIIFTLLPGKMDENKTLMTYSDKPIGMVRTAYRHAKMSFDTPSTRNAFIDVFKR